MLGSSDCYRLLPTLSPQLSTRLSVLPPLLLSAALWFMLQGIMRRFFIKPDNLSGDSIEVTGPEARHMFTVLRLQPGQTVEFFDNTGMVYHALLEECSKSRLLARVNTAIRESNSLESPLTLAQALLKGKKMDLLIQKATELGVQRFIPVTTRYSELSNRRERQFDRWQRIMIEACKQCHRALPMQIAPVTSLDELCLDDFLHRLIAWEKELTPLDTDFSTSPGPILLLVGPEGGLHTDEVQLLQHRSATLFSLGSRILRAETAAIAAISITQYLVGNLNPRAG